MNRKYFFAFILVYFQVMKDNPILDNHQLAALSYDELTEKSKKDHQSIVKTMDNRDNALCLVVLGGISLVVSVLFFILSFKRKFNKLAGIDTGSLQFYVCIICGAIGLVLLLAGIVFVYVNHLYRIAYNKEIAAIAKLKEQMADNK